MATHSQSSPSNVIQLLFKQIICAIHTSNRKSCSISTTAIFPSSFDCFLWFNVHLSWVVCFFCCALVMVIFAHIFSKLANFFQILNWNLDKCYCLAAKRPKNELRINFYCFLLRWECRLIFRLLEVLLIMSTHCIFLVFRKIHTKRHNINQTYLA